MTRDRQCEIETVHREHTYDLVAAVDDIGEDRDSAWTVVEGNAYFCDGVLPGMCSKRDVHEGHPWTIPYQGQRWCYGIKASAPISLPTGCTCTADDCLDPHCPVHGSLRGQHTDGVGSRHLSPKMISPGLWPRPTGIIEVHSRVILSLLPLDHVDCDVFAITVEWRGPRPYMFEAGREDIGQWAICRMGRNLSRDRDWHFEQHGGNADETEEQRKAWLRYHRFTYTEAMPIAKSMLPMIVVNRVSVQTILDRDCPL